MFFGQAAAFGMLKNHAGGVATQMFERNNRCCRGIPGFRTIGISEMHHEVKYLCAYSRRV